MIMDTYSEFCSAVALNTGAPGTFLIGEQYDSGLQLIRDLGVNRKPLYLVIQVDTAVTSAGAATVEFKLASDDSAAISTSTSTVHITTGAIPKASLIPGYRWVSALPMGANYEQYLGILQTTGVAALTAGAINAFLTLDPQAWQAMPEGVN